MTGGSGRRQPGIRGVSDPGDMTRRTTRRERQKAEILSAVRDGRVAHAVDLAFEHFEEFGVDRHVAETLADAVAERRDPVLTAELDACLVRADTRSG